MSEHEAFLKKIAIAPNDDATRLVYADWLEEKGDARAALLRAQVHKELTSLPLQTASQTDQAWLAQIDRPEIENCQGLQFQFQCPKKWEELAATAEGEKVRFCGACQQQVYHCTSVFEAQRHATEGHCVAVNTFLPRAPGDLAQRRPVAMMGAVAPLQLNRYPQVTANPPFPEPKKWWQFWR